MRIIYGINPVAEALKAGPAAEAPVERLIVSMTRTDTKINSIINAARAKKIPVQRVSPQALDEMTGTIKHQGVALAFGAGFRYSSLDDIVSAWKKSNRPAFILLLDSIQDPQNLGSIVRAANAAGVHGIVIPSDRACEVTPTVVKTSAGATAHVMIARETNLTRAIELLKAQNVWVAAIEADCKDDIFHADLKGDMALVIGSEGKGIRRLVRQSCDFGLSIPMNKDRAAVGSLNAAQAGAIAMFETLRQRLS